MLAPLLVVTGQVATIFSLIGVGLDMGRIKQINSAGTKEMSNLLMNVVILCVIVDSFQNAAYDPSFLEILGTAIGVLILCYVLRAVMVQFLFRKEGDAMRPCLRFGCMYGNTGFMGIPLVAAVLGDGARIFAVVSMLVLNTAIWSHGTAMMGGRSSISVKKIVLSPGVMGAVIGIPLFLAQVKLPGALGNAVGFLGDLNTGLAMVIIGAQMARTDLLSTFRDGKLYAAAAVKLIVLPLMTAAILLLLPIQFEFNFFVAIVILSGAPCAGITSMMAEKYGKDAERSAQLVSLSNLLSIVTLPVVTVLAETLAG